jgi:cation diffusion facilitator family transporter
MDVCCQEKEHELAVMQATHGRVLRIVLAINVVFFLIEFTAGIFANSTALLADSLDMLGDAFVYGLSLFVLSRSVKWKAGASIAKGVINAAFGVGVLLEAFYKGVTGQVPVYETIGLIGALALLANLVCFALLYGHRADNLNMRSTWLCSRNDIIANAGVLVAALGVYATRSVWPDVLIGGAIAVLFLKSALTVLTESLSELRRAKPIPFSFI